MRFPLSSLTYFERGRGNLKIKVQQEQSKQIVLQVLPLKDLDKTETSFQQKKIFFSKNTACLSTSSQKTPKHLTFVRLTQGLTLSLYSAIVFIRLSAWMHKQRQKTNQGEFVIFEGENGKYVCTAMPSHPHIRDTQLYQIFLSYK